VDPADQPVRLGASVLGAHGHTCAFFHDRDEEYRAFHIVEHGRRRGFRQTLVDVIRTHPQIIIGGILHELRGRAAAGDGSA
jgi:hypothetical protein